MKNLETRKIPAGMPIPWTVGNPKVAEAVKYFCSLGLGDHFDKIDLRRINFDDYYQLEKRKFDYKKPQIQVFSTQFHIIKAMLKTLDGKKYEKTALEYLYPFTHFHVLDAVRNDKYVSLEDLDTATKHVRACILLMWTFYRETMYDATGFYDVFVRGNRNEIRTDYDYNYHKEKAFIEIFGSTYQFERHGKLFLELRENTQEDERRLVKNLCVNESADKSLKFIDQYISFEYSISEFKYNITPQTSWSYLAYLSAVYERHDENYKYIDKAVEFARTSYDRYRVLRAIEIALRHLKVLETNRRMSFVNERLKENRVLNIKAQEYIAKNTKNDRFGKLSDIQWEIDDLEEKLAKTGYDDKPYLIEEGISAEPEEQKEGFWKSLIGVFKGIYREL